MVVVAQAEPGGHAGCCADADVMYAISRTTAKVIALPRMAGIGVAGICLLLQIASVIEPGLARSRSAPSLPRSPGSSPGRHRSSELSLASWHQDAFFRSDEKSRATR